MTENNVTPKIGEIWELTNCNSNWLNVVVLDIADEGKSFIVARISTTDLPVNYSGLNVEIIDSFSTKVSSSFVIYIEKTKKVSNDIFSEKRGKLNNEDWKRVKNNYLKYKNTMETRYGKKN